MQEAIDQFFIDFRQDYLAGAEANANYQLAEFMESACEEIRENGDAEGYEFCHYDTGRGTRVDGYWFDDEGGLSLFVSDFDFRDGVESLTQTEVSSAFKRVVGFFQASAERNLYLQLEVTSAEYGLARQIADRSDEIKKLTFFLVSERRLSDRVHGIDSKDVCGRSATYQVWDIGRLYRQRLARGQREPLQIDFVELFGRGIPCLPAHLGHQTFSSYLVVVPGRVLADLYERFGARLLEQNVRSFLQNRGDVNKGIRSTLLKEPGMFFAYNNGITATASQIDTEAGPTGLIITSLQDLQIVNGGQTTASLFHTRRNDKVSLSEVFVQMKLSIVDPSEGERIVPRIAEYANTQNRVNAADLFSNSPFHIRMEELSRRLYAPAADGAIRGTKWFYERTRGQFADEISKRSPAEQRRFLSEYPKAQVFGKTDLAKYENVWDDHPRIVNLGAQKNFAAYAKRIAKDWEADDATFNEFYFKRAIARVLIFRSCERLVSAQPWYDGGYRANIVAYGIALIGEVAHLRGMVLDSARIWKAQSVPEPLLDALRITTLVADREIRNPAPGISNVTEWCKRDACWERIRAKASVVAGELPESFRALLVPSSDERIEKREARKDQTLVDGVAAVVKVLSLRASTWRDVRDRLTQRRLLTDKDLGILGYVTQEPSRIPSEKQAKILVELLSRAEDEGMKLPD